MRRQDSLVSAVVEQGGVVAVPTREITACFCDPAGSVLGLYQERGSS